MGGFVTKRAYRIRRKPNGVQVEYGRHPIPIPDEDYRGKGNEPDVETLPWQGEPRLGGETALIPSGAKGQKRPANGLGNAVRVMHFATDEEDDDVIDDAKDPAAQALGAKGGKKRAASMTPKRRAEIARKAAEKRWSQKISNERTEDPSSPQWERQSFGERIRSMRKSVGWTLAQLAGRSGLALSTISKAERGLIALTYDSILRLAYAFDMEMSELLSDQPASVVSQIVTVERKGQAQKVENDYYIMNMLCSARTHKRMMPVFATIKAHSVEEFTRFINHPGEEFVYVLEGQLTFQIEGEPPRVLEPGDSVYFDSGLGHAYLSTGAAEARLIVVCWHPPPGEGNPVDGGTDELVM